VDGVSGVAVDIDADGALVVNDAEGRRHRVVAGDVS
jgi:biotin-(acetyl-CoA carboxylase) ligase